MGDSSVLLIECCKYSSTTATVSYQRLRFCLQSDLSAPWSDCLEHRSQCGIVTAVVCRAARPDAKYISRLIDWLIVCFSDCPWCVPVHDQGLLHCDHRSCCRSRGWCRSPSRVFIIVLLKIQHDTLTLTMWRGTLKSRAQAIGLLQASSSFSTMLYLDMTRLST